MQEEFIFIEETNFVTLKKEEDSGLKQEKKIDENKLKNILNFPKQSPLKQIRKQCRECWGGSVKAVRDCHATDCALWLLRFGKRPKTFIRENRRDYQFNRAKYLKRNSH